MKEAVEVDALRQRIAALEKELTAYKRYRQVVDNLLAGGFAKLGVAFFETMVLDLALHLQADYTFVGELIGERKNRIRIISSCAAGRLGDRFEYDL